MGELIPDQVRAALQQYASDYAESCRGKMGYPRSAALYGRLLDRNQFCGKTDVLHLLRQVRLGDSAFPEARQIIIEAIARKPGWGA